MNIAEMHVYFRQYAQRMGLQNVRSILPEEIDILLNTSINDIINLTIKEHLGNTSDTVSTHNTKLGQVNAFGTLYKVSILKLSDYIDADNPEVSFTFDAADRDTGRMKYLPTVQHGEHNVFPEFLHLVDFSINYKVTTSGFIGNPDQIVQPTFDVDAKVTNWFPVRLVEDMYLAEMLNDNISKNRLNSPIIVSYNNGTYDLYIDKFAKKDDSIYYTLKHNLLPHELRVAYLAKPAKVRFLQDIPANNVDCDLPESLHIDVVRRAVDLYHNALTGTMSSNSTRTPQQDNQ